MFWDYIFFSFYCSVISLSYKMDKTSPIDIPSIQHLSYSVGVQRINKHATQSLRHAFHGIFIMISGFINIQSKYLVYLQKRQHLGPLMEKTDEFGSFLDLHILNMETDLDNLVQKKQRAIDIRDHAIVVFDEPLAEFVSVDFISANEVIMPGQLKPIYPKKNKGLIDVDFDVAKSIFFIHTNQVIMPDQLKPITDEEMVLMRKTHIV